MRVTVVMASHAGGEDVEQVYVYAGEHIEHDAKVRATAAIANDMLRAQKIDPNTASMDVINGAIEEVIESVDIVIKYADLEA